MHLGSSVLDRTGRINHDQSPLYDPLLRAGKIMAKNYMGENRMTEKHIRTFTRAVTWRITAILLTLLFTDASTALAVGVVHTIAHYIHERIWLRVDWGRS